MHPLTTDLAEQILALVKIEAYSLLGAIQDGKTVLGGSAGSDGGTGDPPAGFVGQLTQSNVTFDTEGDTRACSAGSAGGSSLVDNLDAIRLGIEICSDAIGDRHIDWGTGAGQVSAVDVPFQSSSGSISATDVREAIEEAWLHGGGTGGSVTGSGVTNQVAYWTTAATIGGDAGFTYDAATNTITLTGGITLNGAANIITIPDALADALEIVDGTTGDEYLGLKTSAQKEIVLNEDGVDIDFRVEAVGVAYALLVQGSDGFVGVGAPPNVRLTVQDTGAAIVTVLDLESAQPSDDDNTVRMRFRLKDDTEAIVDYGHITAVATNADSTSRETRIEFAGWVANAWATMMSLHRGNLGVGTLGPGATIHADNVGTLAQPVLWLDQGDVSEEMIKFSTTIGIGNAIEAVGAKTLTVTHFIKVTLPGPLTRYIPVGTIA